MFKKKFILLCGLFLLICTASVSADENVTADPLMMDENAGDVTSISIDSAGYFNNDSDNAIDVNSNDLEAQTGDDFLNAAFDKDDCLLKNQSVNVKLATELIPVNTTVIKGDFFNVLLKDQYNKSIAGAKVSFKINGNTYKNTTDSNGNAALNINLAENTYAAVISYAGNDNYEAVSRTVDVRVCLNSTLIIGNDDILTKGYLRIYLKSESFSAVSNRTLNITVGDKRFIKTTNSEGIVIFKPKVGIGVFNVTAVFAGQDYILASSVFKQVNGINASMLNPLKSEIPLKNGTPNVDYMSSKYVMADEDMTYTLLKAQYQEVIKRDSYCLYLNKKLSNYTFFKSQAEPKLNHIIKREKWNVIERAINTKIVKKNKNGYWPSKIKVSLLGKSYHYPEVRDVQDTGYTCGPTSSSMCSQVLRNYVNEKKLAVQAGSDPDYGSSTSGLKKAMEKNNFKCKVYYKSTFSKALKHLKKGGCALVFHTWYHYVAILDISADGKMVLVGNPSGDYYTGSHGIPTGWLTVDFMVGKFNDYDTSGLIVKLKYSLSEKTKTKINNFYSSFGKNWIRSNTNETIPQI